VPLFRTDTRGIGRGEVAESRLEFPIFAMAMLAATLVLLSQHLYLQNSAITVAMAVSLVVFGVTVARVEFGVYILVIAMLLSPEIEVSREVSGERELNLRYDDLLIVVIFFGVMIKLAFEGRLALWQPSPINIPIATYYGVCLFSSLMALERGLPAWDWRTAAFVLIKMMQFYMVFLLVGHAIRTLTDVRKQLNLYFFVAMVVSVYGIYTIGTEPRVSAPFEKGGTEPNTLGGYLVLVICVLLGLWTQAPTLGRKFNYLAMACIAAVPLLYTLSRASYIAFLVGVTVVALAGRKFVLIAALALMLLTSTVIMPDAVIERVAYTFQEEGGKELGNTGITVDKSTHERFHVWRKVGFILQRALNFALFGGGVSWESVLDSQYARVILETGLVGLAAFLFLQYRIVRTAREAYRCPDVRSGRALRSWVLVVALALIAHSVGTISFLIVRIMEPYWFLVAMTAFVRNDAIAKHRAKWAAQQRARDADKDEAVSGALPPATA